MFQRFTGKVAYLSSWFGLKIGCGIAKVFPQEAFWLADRFADIGYHCFRGFRNRSVDNLRFAFGDRFTPPAIDAIVRRSLRNFFRAFVESAVAVKSSDDELRRSIPLEGREHLEAALAKGNGVLVLSAHLGNFFLVGCRIAIEGYEAYVLVNQPRDGSFAKLMDDYRLKARQRTIHARPRREALRQLNSAMRRNRLAVMIADEFRQGKGIEVPFFDGMVISRRGPVTLALRTGAAIVPACLVRQTDDSLKLVIEPELELERSGRGAAQIRENTIRITRWLERTTRTYPDQWNWMNIRWWVANREKLGNQEQQLKQAV